MSGARKRSRNATLAWLTRQVVRAIDVAKAGLHWAFGEAGPAHSANESIRRHIIAGSVLVGVLAFGLGGWASTAEISGALIAPGDRRRRFQYQESAASHRRRGRQIVRA